ncbi:hypothetical protein DESUT3_11790 [Desulfuromonas versatilis]|uniref:Pyroglutamyl-peptidase I n=1 Tax=Desulfuromonas versatilis TaxID=2802975 RepID=A0ABN6DVL6_9BACT|nr:hypothetical protein [Desulfuromonas versatilis]BCR04110.1 hypothetical protein DESUT3_11790 [Desulfuromonas versatilis]
MTVLISGFRRADGAANASALLVDSLRRDLPEELRLQARLLRFELLDYDEAADGPSQQARLQRQLSEILSRHAPQICLFTGQAPGRNRISIERLALNLFGGEVIEPGGPVGCWSTLPDLPRLAGLLLKHGIPAELSSHAGTYLCNHLLYSALRLAQMQGGGPLAGFVHLPVNPLQLDSYPGDPFMPLEMVRKAISLIALQIIEGCG